MESNFRTTWSGTPVSASSTGLASPEVRDRLILKGGSLIPLWMPEPFRSTRDIDVLALEENREEAIRDAVKIVCAVSCTEDGLEFDVDTLKTSSIREGQPYGGQSATLTALLGAAKATVRIDFGFGDAVSPEEAVMPTLIESLPAPSLLVYPMVSVIAEKFQGHGPSWPQQYPNEGLLRHMGAI